MIKCKKGMYLMPMMSIACNYPPSLQKYCTLTKSKAGTPWEQSIMDLTDLNSLIQDICIRGSMPVLKASAINQVVFCIQSRLYKYYHKKYWDKTEMEECDYYPYVLGEMLANVFRYLDVQKQSIAKMIYMLQFTRKHKDYQHMVTVFKIIKEHMLSTRADNNHITNIIADTINLIDQCKDFKASLKEAEKIDPRYKKMFHDMGRLFTPTIYKIASDNKRALTRDMKDSQCISLIAQHFTKCYPLRKFNLSVAKPSGKIGEIDKLETQIAYNTCYMKYKVELKKIAKEEMNYIKKTYGAKLCEYPYPFNQLLKYFEAIYKKYDLEEQGFASQIEYDKVRLEKAKKDEKKRKSLLQLKEVEDKFIKGETMIIPSRFSRNKKECRSRGKYEYTHASRE